MSKTLRQFLMALVLVMFGVMGSKPAPAQESPAKLRNTVEKTEPLYPALARKNGIVGKVKLRVVVTADGKAMSVETVGGNPVFIQSAVDSVKKWKWVPSGQETTEIIEVNFEK